MGKMLVLLLGLALVGFLGYRAMYGKSAVSSSSEEVSAPKERLENVKGAAKRIEDQQNKAADDALQKTTAE